MTLREAAPGRLARIRERLEPLLAALFGLGLGAALHDLSGLAQPFYRLGVVAGGVILATTSMAAMSTSHRLIKAVSERHEALSSLAEDPDYVRAMADCFQRGMHGGLCLIVTGLAGVFGLWPPLAFALWCAAASYAAACLLRTGYVCWRLKNPSGAPLRSIMAGE